MLPRWLTRLVLAIAVAVLPLQGFAQTLQLILCQPQSTGSVGAAQEDHPHGDASTHAHAGAQHGHGDQHAAADAATSHLASMPDEAADAGHAAHFCCDVVAAAALPGSAPSVARFDFPVLEPARQVLHASVFLELPQRPPLA